MKLHKFTSMAIVVLLAFSSIAVAQSVNQNVTVTVSAINEISTSGGAISMTISTATAGSEPTDATDVGTWAISTNQSTRKVTGQLDFLYSSGVTLKLNLAAPAGATSTGTVTLIAASATDLVTGITQVAQSGMARTYTASTTIANGESAAELQIVTLTITA